MTRRNDELRRRSYDDLMRAAGDGMLEDAIKAVRRYREIRDAGGLPEIWSSPHHGWVIKDLLAGD